jgi:hypothetical protein
VGVMVEFDFVWHAFTRPRMPSDAVRVAVRVRPRLAKEADDREVRVRARPSAHVANDSCASQVVSVDEYAGTIHANTHAAKFDVVLGPDAAQEDVYRVVGDSVEEAVQGVNVCILAYGQTGSGKTHTMIGRDIDMTPSVARRAAAAGGGDDEYEEDDDDFEEDAVLRPRDGWGIIPRAVDHIFALLRGLEAEHTEDQHSPSRSPSSGGETACVTTVACSYLQLYNERVLDLLQQGRTASPLSIHERKRGQQMEVFVRGLSEVR